MKIPGIEGDATAQGHEKETQVLSLAFSGTEGGPKVCASPKKTQISAMTPQKLADAASPRLFMAAAERAIFPKTLPPRAER